MSNKYLFQNAKIKHMENKLLTNQNVQRLLDCASVEDAKKALLEMGFGAGLSLENSLDSIFEQEEVNAVEVLREMNVDGALDSFLFECDYLNLKLLLKEEAIKAKGALTIMPYSVCGHFGIDVLRVATFNASEEVIPSFMLKAKEEVEKLIQEEKANPHIIDTIVDRLMYEHILSLVKKDKALTNYYVHKIDYLNILSFIRVRKLSLDVRFLKESFIYGGELSFDMYESIFEAPLEALKDKCKATAYEDIVNKVIDSNDLVAYEVNMDNILLKMWKDNYNDMESIAPIVSYYLTKKTEIKLAKLIVAGIKNKVDANLIKERMREIYA